jgi:heme/copper-type cytochrome/quinol oxidase subunit 1
MIRDIPNDRQQDSLIGDDEIYSVAVAAHTFVITLFVVTPVVIGILENLLILSILGARSRINSVRFLLLQPPLPCSLPAEL